MAESKQTPLVQDIKFLHNVMLRVRLVYGSKQMTVKELVDLKRGSVLALQKDQGEPFEIHVNGCLMARGEVVVVNDYYGVRITEIISKDEP